jgi:hypothetical protein
MLTVIALNIATEAAELLAFECPLLSADTDWLDAMRTQIQDTRTFNEY